MKKIKYLLFIIPMLLIVLASCSKSKLHVEKTIELKVDTCVVPTFTASFGEGSYNESTKTYTHKIPYIKDLTIYLSYDNLKTEQVLITTEEMKEDIIKKNISFGDVLDCDVSITVKGLGDLTGVTLNMPSAQNVVKSKKNITFKLPSRNATFNGKLAIDNYQDIDLEFTPDDLKTGYYETDYMAVPSDKIYIKLVNNCSVTIYDGETSQKLQDAYNWQYGTNQTSNYVLLPADKSYFVTFENKLFRVNQGENCTIVGNLSSNDNKYYYLDYDYYSNLGYNPDVYFYNKKTKLLTENSTNLVNIDDYGIIYRLNDNIYHYFNDAKSRLELVAKPYQYSTTYYRIVEDGDNGTIISSMANVDVRNIFDNTVLPYTDTSISNMLNMLRYNETPLEFVNNSIKATIKTYPEDSINVNFYNKETNELLFTKSIELGHYFKEGYKDLDFQIDGRRIDTGFIFYNGNVSYDSVNNKYVYPDQYITIDTSIIKIVGIQLYEYDLFDEEGEQIELIQENSYFSAKLSAGKKYRLVSRYEGNRYEFTPTEDDIKAGFIAIGIEINYNTITLPEDVVLVSNSSDTVVKKVDGVYYCGNIYNNSYIDVKMYYKSNPDKYKSIQNSDISNSYREIVVNFSDDVEIDVQYSYIYTYDSTTHKYKILMSIYESSLSVTYTYNSTWYQKTIQFTPGQTEYNITV